MLTASIILHRKPKDGKDGTSVTILSTSVSYQVSASPTEIPESWEDSIKKVKQTDAKPYLWTKTSVAYSDNNTTTTYSVSYKGKDGTNGTSFTPKGMADGFFNNMSSVPTYADGMDYDVYIVNIDDRSNPTSELPPYVCRYEYESLVVYHAEFGDGYNVNGHLYVANSDEWVDFGEIQGAPGVDGTDGKDAINIVFVPSEIVFNANDRGEIDNTQYQDNSAVIRVYRGSAELEYGDGGWTCSINDNNEGDNCNYYLVKESGLWKCRFKNIKSTQLEGTEEPSYVPSSTGGGVFRIKVDGVTYNAYLPFSVNVNTFANALIKDNKKYIQKYTEVSNKYDAVSKELDNKANKNDMEEKISTISQKADNIKLEVLSKTSGRRNMLVNSAFRNQDSVFIHSLARIEKNTGVDGVNCIYSSDKYSGTGDGNYIGAFWDSTQKNGVVTNIPIVKGKKYVISCWIRSDNLDLPFKIECLYMKSINQQSRDGVDTAISVAFKVTEKNKWEKISCVLDTNNADATEYLAVNFWSNNKNVPKAIGADEYPTCHAYICKPMMEEGDTYSGWTLSEDDYDYVGGNMIDNARTLEVGGSLTSINESNVDDYGLAYYGDSMSLRINNTNAYSTPSIMTFKPSLEVGVDYMFSFMAKGTANIGLYALCDNSVDGDNLLSEDSVNADVRIVDTFRNRYASIILIPTQLTTEYKRYWGHMRFYGHVPTKLYLQLNHAGEVYICQPKLEIGATMTEFTERKTDLVDKATLKKAGIEITTNQVKLYGDKVQVLTRKDESSEYVEAGMFVNGKLNANLIDADAIEVKHLWAKSEDGTSKVGYFGNTEKMEACKVDNTYAPLFIGADNAKNAPFHVTQDGAIYALMGRIGKFTLTDNGIFEYDNGAGGTHKPMQLSETCIYFTHTTDHVNNDRIIWMGSTDFVKPVYGISNLLSDIWIDDRVPEPTSSKACLVLRAEGGTSEQSNIYGEPTGNFAICASKGMYAGFRPMTRTISKSMALSELDCYVEVTAAVTLTLPANPQRGQTYWIMRSVGKGVKTIVKGNGKQVYTPSGNGETVEFTSANEIIWLTYIKDNWKALWVTP